MTVSQVKEKDFKNKRAAVFGLGKSGVASAKKLVSLGAKVHTTDSKFGEHTLADIEGADLIVVSPGIHLDLPPLAEAKKKGVPIISEIELAYQLLSKPIIAVTGTNGKTTTATLIGEMLKAGGKRVAVAGNIGNPLVEVDDSELDFIVAEISSYQLEAIKTFRPWISLILNLQEDHLERHRSFEEYAKSKAKIFMNQNSHDYLIYNADDQAVANLVRSAKTQLIPFSKKHPEILPLNPEQIKIPGRHNLENALAAAQAAYLCGIDKTAVARVLRTFPGVEHRIEYVTTINGIEFYNDSKATNPDSTLVALETFAGRGVIVILGGRDKGTDLTALMRKVKESVKAVVLIGEATERFKEALEEAGYHHFHLANSLGSAVKLGFSLAETGDLVLLSPACASFDVFADFEERGREFKKICQNLK